MIYEKRGLEKDLAMKVAVQLSAGDRLGAHLRDELGIDQTSLARPMQAAWISAASFAFFATIPIAALLVAPVSLRIPLIAVLSLVSLAAFWARLAVISAGRPWAAHRYASPWVVPWRWP
jgi:vacuolar iron transporter family protein